MDGGLRCGEGWRLGWRPEAPHHQGLVGAETWAIELTQAELNDFCHLCGQLQAAIALARSELMEEEAIACTVSTDRLLLELSPEGTLFLQILHGRRAEGLWAPQAIAPLLAAAAELAAIAPDFANSRQQYATPNQQDRVG